MWHSLTHNWNLARVMRLLLGIMITYQGFHTYQNGIVLMGAFFTVFSLFTSGCCGTTCSRNPKNDIETKNENIIYEEVK